jgi:WD40 repeat protein
MYNLKQATKAEYANIIIWSLDSTTNNAKSYRQLCVLGGHELTIVQLCFSNNGDYLLSVSRDRSWYF